MIDTGLPVREAYFAALDGNIVVDSTNVPVYDQVPDTTAYPFVVLFGQDEVGGDVDARTKDNKNASEISFEIHIVTGFQGGDKKRGKKFADQIGAEVLLLVLGATRLTFEGVENITTSLESMRYEIDKTDTHTVITKEIIIRHLISQA